MHLVIRAPFWEAENGGPLEEDRLNFDNEGNCNLGYFLGPAEDRVRIVQINGKYVDDWQRFIPGDEDRVEVIVGAGPPIVVQIVMMVVMMLINILMQVLAPKPKKPSPNSAQPSIGIAGISNTVAPGTVKFLVYGKRIVFGHIIASTVTIAGPLKNKQWKGLFRHMSFSVTYFMGAGPIKAIVNPKINGTDIADITGAAYDTRLGYDDQTIFPGHENVNQVYTDARPFGIPTAQDKTIKDPLIYTTRGEVDRATIFINFPTGIYSTRLKGNKAGSTNTGIYEFEVKYKKNGTDLWTTLPNKYSWSGRIKDGVFSQIVLDFDETARYDISLQVTRTRYRSQTSGPPTLFNVMETQFVRTAYPGSSLLNIQGVDSGQINSLDAMQVGALVYGRIIPTWDPDCSLFVNNWTQSRAFVIRDLMCNVDHGMGASFPERLMDDGSLVDALINYEADQVTGYDGTEDRDHCDVTLSEAKAGQDWVKNLCFEGDTRLIPSRGRFKYIIDLGDADEMRNYSEPDGVIEASVNVEFGMNDRPVNVILGEFSDENQDYKLIPCRLEKTGGLNGEQEVSEQASYVSITRASQVERRMRKDLNVLTLVDEFYDWKAPKHALQSEVWDPVLLSFKTIDFFKGYSGFVGPGSTTTSVNLNQEVTILPSLTYHLYIKALSKKGVQDRVVSSTAGTRTSVTVTSAFIDVAEGYVWMLGVPDTHVPKVKIEEIKRDKDGTYDIRASVIKPEVYDIDNPLVQITDGINTSVSEDKPFQPIMAQVKAGSGQAEFKVAPGFDHYVGTTVDVQPTYIQLPATEPSIDDFFKDYSIEVGSTGNVIVIDSYEGSSRKAFVSRDPRVTGAQPYKLSAPDPGLFAGFSVEHSISSSGPWAALSSTTTTSLNVAGYQASTEYFRITPLSQRGTENTVGRWVIKISAGDSIAPEAPTATTPNQLADKLISISTDINLLLARDVWKLHVQLREDSASGTVLASTEQDISDLRDEDTTADSSTVNVEIDMSAQDDGTFVFAVVWIEDYFGNISAIVSSTEGVEIQTNETDDNIDDGTDASTSIVTNTTTQTSIASVTVPGGGLGEDGMVMLGSFIRITDDDAANNATITLRLVFKNVTVATMTVRTSDVVSNMGADRCWKVIGYLFGKQSTDDPVGYLERIGVPLVTGIPYPGSVAQVVRGVATTKDLKKSGVLEITAQWSAADTGLSLTKDFSWHQFFINTELQDNG